MDKKVIAIVSIIFFLLFGSMSVVFYYLYQEKEEQITDLQHSVWSLSVSADKFDLELYEMSKRVHYVEYDLDYLKPNILPDLSSKPSREYMNYKEWKMDQALHKKFPF